MNTPNTNKLSRRKEDVENTIFVANLPNTTDRKALWKLFRKFGHIENVRFRCATRKELNIPKRLAVIKKEFHDDSTYINAFIKFDTTENCNRAMKKMNGKVVEGHHLRVTLAGDIGAYHPKMGIFIGNLSLKIQDDDLWNAFEDCGPIYNVRVIRDSKTGIGKGFGYVNFKSADSVELALRLNGMLVVGREVRISRVVPDDKLVAHARRKAKKAVKVKERKTNNTKQIENDQESKPRDKVKAKHGYQGKKTKPSLNTKSKKKKKFDKKKVLIKQIAEKMEKKK